MKQLGLIKLNGIRLYIVLAVAFGVLLSPPPTGLAQEPDGVLAPSFSAQEYGSQGGAIYSQNTTLDAPYLADTGEMEGVELRGDSLVLVEGSTRGTYTSAPIASPLGNTTDVAPLWLADVPPGTELSMETAVSYDGQGWSDWLPEPVEAYPVRDGEYGGALIWVDGGAVQVRFRVTMSSDGAASPSLRHVALFFNDTSPGVDTAQAVASVAEASAAGSGIYPGAISRYGWGCPDGSASPRWWPRYQNVTHAIIHHTATPNRDPGSTNWASVVRSVWNYHANVLWWGDVGYNYLVDPLGNVYEGRAGGDNVVGAHDSLNAGSMGIGFIGCYGNCYNMPYYATNAEPSWSMLDAGRELIKWKFQKDGLNPTEHAYYHGRYVPRVAGGRDVTTTASPGDLLYAKLYYLRDWVVTPTPTPNPTPTPTPTPSVCTVSMLVSTDKVDYLTEDAIYLVAKLTDNNGTPVDGASVTAQVTRPDGTVEAAAEADASASMFFRNQPGEYYGIYRNTGIPGTYRFLITASGNCSNGVGFTPVTQSVSFSVQQRPTGGDLTLSIEPSQAAVNVGQTANTGVHVGNAVDLYALNFSIEYNSSVVEVVDADTTAAGVQVGIGPLLSGKNYEVVRNEVVDLGNNKKRINFAFTLIGSVTPVSGSGDVATIAWQGVASGQTTVPLSDVQAADDGATEMPVQTQDGIISVTGSNSSCEQDGTCILVQGRVQLQGRADVGGVAVASSDGSQTVTASNGDFSMMVPKGYSLSFGHPGYLSAKAEGTANLLGTVLLPAGDVNGDDVIDILDLSYIASRMNEGAGSSAADFNADGKMDLLDLVMAAANYGKQGPVVAWK